MWSAIDYQQTAGWYRPKPAGGGGGSVAIDAKNSNSVNGAAGTTYTIALTLSGSATALLVGTEEYLGTGVIITGVTCGASSMTSLDSQQQSAVKTTLWGLASPPTGAQTITITFSGVGGDSSAGVISFTGANASTPFGTTAKANAFNGGPASINVVSASGNIVFDFMGAAGGDPFTPGGGQTSQFGLLSNGGNRAVGSTQTASGASTTMSCALTSTADWAQIGVAVKP